MRPPEVGQGIGGCRCKVVGEKLLVCKADETKPKQLMFCIEPLDGKRPWSHVWGERLSHKVLRISMSVASWNP